MKHVWWGPLHLSSDGPSYMVNRCLEREGRRDDNKWSGVDLQVTVTGKGARTLAGKLAKLLKAGKL